MSKGQAVAGWGPSWIALAIALGLHVWDEAAHDFLSFYNPMVAGIRERVPFLPVPTFSYRMWLTGLIVGVGILLLTSVFAFRGARWLRPLAYALAVLMIANGLLHAAGSIYYGRLMPGLYSSPVLIASSIWLLVQLRQTRLSGT